MRLIFWLAAAGLYYLSIYPLEWDWTRAWRAVPYFPPRSRGEVMDCILNLACYLPIGFLGVLAHARAGSRWKWVAAITALGTALSYSVEVWQLFLPARYPNLRDVIFNAAGTLIGALAAAPLAGRARRMRASTDVVVVGLVFAWVCWQAFPFTPSRSPLIEGARWGWFQFLIEVCGTMLLTALFRLQTRAPGWAAWAAAFVNPLQAWFSSFSLVRLAGVVSGLAAGTAFRGAGPVAWAAIAWAALGLVLAEPVFPWRPGEGSAVEWRPFQGVFEFYQAEYLRRLFGRFFFAGCALWFAARAGWGWAKPLAAAVALTAVSIWMQSGLPGRQPDVTEVLMVAAAALWARLDRQRAKA